MPGDLAQAMMAATQDYGPETPPADLLQSTVSMMTATHEVAANTKTVQAIDAMLEELSRMQSPTKTDQTQ